MILDNIREKQYPITIGERHSPTGIVKILVYEDNWIAVIACSSLWTNHSLKINISNGELFGINHVSKHGSYLHYGLLWIDGDTEWRIFKNDVLFSGKR